VRLKLLDIKIPLLVFTKNQMPHYLIFPQEFIPALSSLEFPHLILNNSYPSGVVLCLFKDFLKYAPCDYIGSLGQVNHITPYGLDKETKEARKKNKITKPNESSKTLERSRNSRKPRR
jgi:hypothetical protein